MKEINKNMLRERATKLEEITDEKWLLVSQENRSMYEEFLGANKHLSPKTLKQYRTCLKQFFWFAYENFKDKPFYKITKRDFIKYIGSMQDRKLSSSAIGLRKSSVSSFCNYIENIVAGEMEECEKFRNFTRGMPSTPKTQCYNKIAVSEDEYKLIMKTLEERKDYLGMCWTATAFNVGARRAELVQFKTEILGYKKQKGENFIKSHIVRGKGESIDGKPIQFMINPETIKYMKLWVENREYESDYIFTAKYNKEINAISISWANDFCTNTLSPILGRRINPHLFKASCISNYLEKGADMTTISRFIAHHEDISTTSKYYDLRDFGDEKNKIFDL